LTKQQKRGRPRSESPMVHTAVVLPRDLLERLKRDAKAQGRGLSTEIRRLLQLILDLKGVLPRDKETADMVDSIQLLANNLAGDLGVYWYEHPYALAAFKAGVAAFLAQYQPPGDANVRPDTRVFGEPNDPADVVGRTHARAIWVAKGGVTDSELA
jgi:hypothetical protein